MTLKSEYLINDRKMQITKTFCDHKNQNQTKQKQNLFEEIKKNKKTMNQVVV